MAETVERTIDLQLSRWQIAVVLYLAGVGMIYHVVFFGLVALQHFTGYHLPCPTH